MSLRVALESILDLDWSQEENHYEQMFTDKVATSIWPVCRSESFIDTFSRRIRTVFSGVDDVSAEVRDETALRARLGKTISDIKSAVP